MSIRFGASGRLGYVHTLADLCVQLADVLSYSSLHFNLIVPGGLPFAATFDRLTGPANDVERDRTQRHTPHQILLRPNR